MSGKVAYSHTNPLTGRSTQCKVCNSKHCKEIEKMMDSEMSGGEIFRKCIRLSPKEKISIGSILNHRKKHRKLPKKSSEKKKPEKKSNLKLFEKKEIKGGAAEEERLSGAQLKSLTEFLDLVIEKVQTEIESGDLKPTVSEAVKAAEIKLKAKEDSKWEKELVKFFMEVSEAHGYSH